MTALDKIIRSRKSTYPKDFTGEQVTQAEIEQLIQAAVYAPNHKKTTPWKFIVFRENATEKLGKHVAELYQKITPAEKFNEKKFNGIQEKFKKSSAIICLIGEVSGKVPEWEDDAALAMATQNLWLKATELNIGGYWGSPSMIHHIKPFLELADHQKCAGFFFLGKTDTAFEPRDYEWQQFVSYRD